MDRSNKSEESRRTTGLLRAWREGDQAALQELIPLVHDELRRVARRYMSRERAGQTLQPTALVNEAYLRLAELREMRWQDRAHFVAMAARLMRRVLVDIARSKGYQKRGQRPRQVSLDPSLIAPAAPAEDVVALDEALTKLAALSSRRARVIELRFFGGLSLEETAEALSVSSETVKRDWRLSRAWLHKELATNRQR
jgi:RNA polymerase sigma factor (TIGR02999 family)